jgi:hypothetical protein
VELAFDPFVPAFAVLVRLLTFDGPWSKGDGKQTAKRFLWEALIIELGIRAAK